MSKSRILLAALVATGCGGGTNVTVDFDREATFAGRETYTWVFLDEKDRALSGAPTPASQDRIIEAMDSALTAMGYRKVTPPTDPDLLVGFAVTREDKTDVQQVYTDVNLGYAQGQTTVRTFQEGTLIIYFGDPIRKEVIWQGSGTEAFQNPSQETVNKRIGEIVKRILKEFPPE
jgi:hypothetical protein